jgi:propionyl-CoA synthetase
MKVHEKGRYHEVYARSLADPEGFWAEAARDRLDRAGEEDLRPSLGTYGRWFTDAVVNTCYNALDRHVAPRWQVALIHDPRSATRSRNSPTPNC